MYLSTFTGKKFYPGAPKAEDIDIIDVAHALSHNCRFGGHTPFHYSVAQHCVYCVRIAERYTSNPHDLMWCLLHDASEAYAVDIPQPLKNLLPEYLVIEKKIMDEVCKHFNLNPVQPEIATKVDRISLATEARDIMGDPKDWSGIKEKATEDFRIEPWHPTKAKEEFLKTFTRLSERRIEENT